MEGLVIATGGEGEEGEKVDLKVCLALKMNQGLQRERHWPLFQGGLLNICTNVLLQILCSSISTFLSPERPLAIGNQDGACGLTL